MKRELLARNPVAQALLVRKAFNGAIKQFQIHLYGLTDGIDASKETEAGVRVLNMCSTALEMAGYEPEPSIDTAIDALKQCQNRGGRWQQKDTEIVDYGLTAAIQLSMQLKSSELTAAFV
jgi:hypothetical protein